MNTYYYELENGDGQFKAEDDTAAVESFLIAYGKRKPLVLYREDGNSFVMVWEK